MKIITTILLVIAGAAFSADNSSIQEILEKAPLLDAPGPGYPCRGIRGIDIVSAEPRHPGKGNQLDLYSTPTFGITPSKSNCVDPWNEELRRSQTLSPKKLPLLDAPGPGYRGARGGDEPFY